MCNYINQYTQFFRSVAALFLGIGLLSSCNQSHQLGMEDNPQEILDRKLDDPQSVLTPSESITLLNHDGELTTRDEISESLTESEDRAIAILANHMDRGSGNLEDRAISILANHMDRGSGNLDFGSLEQCRAEPASLDPIPGQEAAVLSQAALNDEACMHSLDIALQLRDKIVTAVTQGDVALLGQKWQLFQRLRVIEHPEIEQLIQGEVLPALDVMILQRVDDFKNSIITGNVSKARGQLDQLIIIKHNLSSASIACDINDLEEQLGQV